MAKPSILHQMIAYRQVLRQLGRMGRDFSQELQAAQAIARTSRKPEIYLERLERIEKGDFYEFAWQKP